MHPIIRQHPLRAWLRRGLGLLMLAGLLGLGGCSMVGLGYGQADRWMGWWLGRELSLVSEQREVLAPALTALLRWHRQHELPVLLEQLNRAQALAAQDVTAAQVCAVWDAVNDSLDRSAQQAARQLAPALRGLGPDQLAHWQRQREKAMQKWQQEWQLGTPEARQAAREERALNRLRENYGRWEGAQARALPAQLAQGNWSVEQALADRRHNEALLLRALQGLQTPGLDEAGAAALVQGMWRSFRWPARQSLAPQQQAWQRQQCARLAEWHASANATQRQHLQQRLRGWAQDLGGQVAGR